MSTLLIDGNNLLMRAFFATRRSGMSADGVSTGPLLVFINTLTRHIREEKPDRLAIAWDGGRSTERTALQADYKGNRAGAPDWEEKQSSFALAKQFVTLANLYQSELPGREADDLIAAWWRGVVPPRPPIVNGSIKILSSDKDFLQLLGFNGLGVPTEVIRLSSADTPTDRWSFKRLVDEYGYPPENWPLVTALTGDTSDNVHGVPGIGPKRAVKLLEAHSWDLDAVLEDPKVSEHADQVRMNLRLVDLRHGDLVLPAPPAVKPTRPGDFTHPELLRFLEEFRLSSVINRYLSGTLWDGDAPAVPKGRPIGAAKGPASA